MTQEHKRMLADIEREIEVETTVSAATAAIFSVAIPILLGIYWLLVGY